MTYTGSTPYRCAWAATELSTAYHDQEWGSPTHDDRTLFVFLVLEGAQAGLSWETILKKRIGYRAAFDNFDPVLVASHDDAKIEALLLDPGIVRNRRKVLSAIANARAFLEVQREFGSFDRFIWSFVDHQPVQNAWQHISELPAKTETSDRMSKELIKRGFSFVGSTICYAFMQATGMVNDHEVRCFRYAELSGQAANNGGPVR